jgi:hypothetical protein
MNSSEGQQEPTTATTEIVLLVGERYRVKGDVRHVERDPGRGSPVDFDRR